MKALSVFKYVRLIIEAYEAIIITVFYEIMQYNGEGGGRLVSLSIALFFFILVLSFPVFTLIHFMMNRKTEKQNISPIWVELYSDVRPGSYTGLYTTVALTRTIIFVGVVIFIDPIDRILVFMILLLVQI